MDFILILAVFPFYRQNEAICGAWKNHSAVKCALALHLLS